MYPNNQFEITETREAWKNSNISVCGIWKNLRELI